MTRYIARRTGFLLVTLLLTSLIVFTVTQYLPGDVARIVLGREAGEEQLWTGSIDRLVVSSLEEPAGEERAR